MRSKDSGKPYIRPPVKRLKALVVDLDGTLTLNGRPIGDGPAGVLRSLKHRGTKLVLATGRCIAETRNLVGDGLFDATVAENGAVLVLDGS